MPKPDTTDPPTPDTSTPDRLGSYIRDVAEDLFTGDSLSEDLRLKCRYLYVHSAIKERQRQGKEVPEGARQAHDELEEKLRQRGFTPSEVRTIRP